MTQTSPAAARQLDAIPVHRKSLSQRLRENWQLYVMLLIPVVLTIVYKYWPMYGIQIAFRDFKASRGITGSEWVGLYWFERFFTAPNCVRMIKNTVLLSLYSLLWSFPIPIILSLCINQLRFAKFKRVVQTVLYAPHFISTMVICGMIKIFLSPSGGLLNLILGTSVDFLSESTAFRTIYVASGIWQEAGWGTIIYMACLAAVDTSLYEAAKIDGASMFQRILHIDIPELVPMIVLQLIMSVGNLMNVGFEKVLLLQTELNKATSDIIAVYVYEQGIINAKYRRHHRLLPYPRRRAGAPVRPENREGLAAHPGPRNCHDHAGPHDQPEPAENHRRPDFGGRDPASGPEGHRGQGQNTGIPAGRGHL